MQEDHHFCRWHLPEGFSAEAALAAAFPNASRAQAAHQLDTCSPKELREVFATIFGSVTTSNNTSWIRQKLKGALGLGGKKQRTTGHAGGRKRSAGPSENGGKRARAASPDSPPAGGHWAAFGPAFGGRSPRLGRSPSSDWDCFSMEEWDTEEQAGDSSAAVAGAATLLAAAAEVESREAAAAAAGTSTGYASPAQLGGGGVASHSHSPAGRALPDSPGGSATGSSLRPPPADASQQVQAFLQGFLQAAQATGASAPAPPAVAATGMPAAATGAAGQAAGQAAGTALPSFLTPQQLSSVGQQAAVFRLLAALAASPNGHPM